MNEQAHVRASSASRLMDSMPVLTAAALTGGVTQTNQLALYATFPNYAPVIVKDLESRSNFYRLDRTLNEVLHIARSTVARSLRRQMH